MTNPAPILAVPGVTEHTGDFRLTMPIQKSYYREDEAGDGHYYVAGIASGVQPDLDGEEMAASAIYSMKQAIDEGIIDENGEWSQVPLRSGHRREWDDILGWVVRAWVDGEHNLWIEAELDPDSPNAMSLYRKLTTPRQHGRPLRLGFSVAGKVRAAEQIIDDLTGQVRRRFLGLSLREISVTGQPAYVPSYVDAIFKSLNWANDRSGKITYDWDQTTLKEQTMTEPNDQPMDGVALAELELEKSNNDDLTPTAEATDQHDATSLTKAVTDDHVAPLHDENVDPVPAAETPHEPDAATSPAIVKSDADADQDPGTTQDLTSVSEATHDALSAATQLDDVVKAVTELTAVVERISEAVFASQPQEALAADAGTPSVSKSAMAASDPTPDNNEVLKALQEHVMALQSRVDALESAPVDQSIAVAKAKFETGRQDLSSEAFVKQLEEQGMSGDDILKASIARAMRRHGR